METPRVYEVAASFTLLITSLIVPEESEGFFQSEELDLCLRKDVELLVASWIEPHIDKVFLTLESGVWCDHELTFLDIINGYVEIWSAADNYQEFAIAGKIHAQNAQSCLHFEVCDLLFAWHLKDLTGWLEPMLSSSYQTIET